MSEPFSRRDFLKATAAVGGGILGLFGIGKVASKVGRAIENAQEQNELDKQKEILEHKAKILETDNTLGVENPVAQFQIECKGQKLSTFVITEKNEYGIPRVFTNYNDKTVELLTWRTAEGDNSVRSWYIPGEDVPEGEKGIKGAIGMQDVLVYHSKADLGNGDRTIFYFPPDDKNSRMVNFDANNEIAYRFKASDLSSKVTSNLPS